MSVSIEINITSDPKMLSVLRGAIAPICKLGGFDIDSCTKIVLAVDEAVSNIMRHAYSGSDDKPISARFNLTPTKMEIVLHDFGKSVDPSKIKSRALDEVRPGGLGVHIMKTVMDKVVYKNGTKDGNYLILEKVLPKEAKSGS